jgi:nucleotide-binding universal stress UspA family protein
MFQRILVALDGSDNAQAVLDKAIAIAVAHQAPLDLVSVVVPFEAEYPNPITMGIDGFHSMLPTEAYANYAASWQALEAQRLKWLSHQKETTQAAGIKAESSLLFGDPGRCLCDAAKQLKADLIVLGRRGRAGLSELLLGSVSNYVMHHAGCSVLVIQ